MTARLRMMLPVLQSGFLGLNQEDYKTPEPFHTPLEEVLRTGERPRPYAKYFYSPEVYELFKRFEQDEIKFLNDFDAREELLALAKKSFSGYPLRVWVALQTKYGLLGASHKVFMAETLKYVFEAKRRTVQSLQWVTLLEATGLTQSKALNTDNSIAVADTSDSIPAAGISVVSDLADWVSRPGGYSDLMVCMYVIFGPRGDTRALL